MEQHNYTKTVENPSFQFDLRSFVLLGGGGVKSRGESFCLFFLFSIIVVVLAYCNWSKPLVCVKRGTMV